MSNLSVFSFESNNVRVVLIDNEPWFVAKDICDVLEVSNVSKALERLDNDEKRDDLTLSDTIGREQQYLGVSESGMYTLVLSSRRPEARPFRKWVTNEVIPSIRKTGSYSNAQSDMSIVLAAINNMRSEFNAQLAPIQQELIELRMLNQAVSQSSGIEKQISAQAKDDFAEYKTLTFIDVVKTFRPFYVQVPKIISRAKHSVGKVFATEQEKELGKISGKYVFSGWEIQTAINCLDRAAKEVFIENYDTSLPLIELIDKMEADRKGR